MTPEEVARLLPAVVQSGLRDGAPLSALVDLLAHSHTSVGEQIAEFPVALSPWRAPPEFVGMLERWVGLEPATAVSEAHARQLIGRAVGLWRMRGTDAGIVRLLELATGLTGFRVHPGGEAFTLVVLAPSEARDQDSRIRRIVALMKPAAVRLVDVEFSGEQDPAA